MIEGKTRAEERRMRLTKAQAEQRTPTAPRGTKGTRRAQNLDALAPTELVGRLRDADEFVAGSARQALLERGRAVLPALTHGLLHHADARVRAACALLLDHLGDATCVTALIQAIENDPVEAVRRCALHALVCDGCKTCPLAADVVTPLIRCALTDRSLAVRRRAVFYLGRLPAAGDVRSIAALHTILQSERDPILLGRARRALTAAA
jgi:HEAT repeat protein